jgi:hypothetical protein
MIHNKEREGKDQPRQIAKAASLQAKWESREQGVGSRQKTAEEPLTANC